MPTTVKASASTSQSPNVNFKERIENRRLTYQQNKETQINSSLEGLIKDHNAGVSKEKLKDKYSVLAFRDQVFNDLTSIETTYRNNKHGIAATAAFIDPNIVLLPLAKRDMQQSVSHTEKPENAITTSEENDKAPAIRDKVAEIISLMENEQHINEQAFSRVQLDNICTELNAGKLQLNQLKGWDEAVNALVNIIDHLRNDAGLEWDKAILLEGRLDCAEAVEVLANAIENIGMNNRELCIDNHFLQDQLNMANENCSALNGIIEELVGVTDYEQGQVVIKNLSELCSKLIKQQVELQNEIIDFQKSNKEIETLKQSIDGHERTISALELKNAELEQQLASAREIGDQETIKQLDTEISGLNNNIKKLGEEIIYLKDKIREKTEENKKLTDDIDILTHKLSDTLNKKERSDKHTAELIAGIVALVASTTLFLVALLPKDDSSEETINNTVDTSDLKSELQNQATELESQIAQDDTTIAKLDDVQAKLADISDAIEGQEDTLLQQENDKIKAAGDKAYQQALAEAKAAAYEDPANQEFETIDGGIIVPSGQLTPEAEAACKAQADSAREAAEAQAKQNIDALLEEAGQLDSQIQAAGSNAAEIAQKIASDRIATQTQLDQINSLISQIPDEVSYVTQNIENTNNGLSEAGFVTTLTTAAVLAAGGTGLLVKYGLNFRKRKDNVEILPAKEVAESVSADVNS